MRVLQLVTDRHRRGAQVFAHALSEALDRLGHSTSIAYLYADDRQSLPMRPQDVAFGADRDHPAERIPGFQPGLLRRISALVGDWRPDVVQVNGSRTVKYGCLAHRPARSGCVLIYRNIGDPSQWLRGRWKTALFRRLLTSRLDGIVGVSEASLREALRIYQWNGPTAQIPRGLDVDAFLPLEERADLRSRLGVSATAPVLLFVGTLAPEKRLDRLLNVAFELGRRLADLELWIVGDGPDAAEIEGSIAAGTPCTVRLLGPQTDVASFMAAADLLLLTSDTEGMPGVVLEAAAAGLPCVSTRVGGLGECVVDGETGILVDRDDESAMVAAAERLLTVPDERSAMADAARRDVKQRFDLPALAVRYADFYEEVLSARRRGA